METQTKTKNDGKPNKNGHPNMDLFWGHMVNSSGFAGQKFLSRKFNPGRNGRGEWGVSHLPPQGGGDVSDHPPPPALF